MKDKSQELSVNDFVLQALENVCLKPQMIPHGNINELRGGMQCYKLNLRTGLDAAILLSKYDPKLIEESNIHYKIDYAIRGTIKGILTGRMISRTTIKLKGVFRKKVENLSWSIPETEKNSAVINTRDFKDSIPPLPGEIWKNGPHEKVTSMLNNSLELRDNLFNYISVVRGKQNLTIITDRWGESIRIVGGLWVKTADLIPVYINSDYIDIIKEIGEIIIQVRREFGGLTF
jgi:hypothetical protein